MVSWAFGKAALAIMVLSLTLPCLISLGHKQRSSQGLGLCPLLSLPGDWITHLSSQDPQGPQRLKR